MARPNGRPTRFGHLEPIDRFAPTIHIAADLTGCPLVIALLRSREGDEQRHAIESVTRPRPPYASGHRTGKLIVRDVSTREKLESHDSKLQGKLQTRGKNACSDRRRNANAFSSETAAVDATEGVRSFMRRGGRASMGVRRQSKTAMTFDSRSPMSVT